MTRLVAGAVRVEAAAGGARSRLRGLYLAQGGDGVADAVGELLDGLDAAPGRVAQLLAQEEPSLADESGQGVVDLMPHVRGQLRVLAQPRLALADDAAQMLLGRYGRPRFVFTHRLTAFPGDASHGLAQRFEDSGPRHERRGSAAR